MKLRIKVAVSAALTGALIGALALNACGTSPPAPIAAHGTLETAVSIMSGDTPADAFPDISDGGQVVVVNSSGAVIATGVLSETSLPGTLAASDRYSFAVTVPGGLPRYGVQVGHNRGTLWYTATQMASKQSLSMCLGDGC